MIGSCFLRKVQLSGLSLKSFLQVREYVQPLGGVLVNVLGYLFPERPNGVLPQLHLLCKVT